VVRADVTDAAAVDTAVAGGDAVLSALGVSYTRKPVTVYSAGTASIIAAMENHGVRRLVVTGSAAYRSGLSRQRLGVLHAGDGTAVHAAARQDGLRR
jgi:putative NADH-flavin reductase